MTYFDFDRAVTGLYFDEVPGLHAAFGRVNPEAEGRGFGEDDVGEGFAGLRGGDDAEERTGAAFFHFERLERGIERTRGEEAFHSIGKDLGRLIVDIGFDDGDGC